MQQQACKPIRRSRWLRRSESVTPDRRIDMAQARHFRRHRAASPSSRRRAGPVTVSSGSVSVDYIIRAARASRASSLNKVMTRGPLAVGPLPRRCAATPILSGLRMSGLARTVQIEAGPPQLRVLRDGPAWALIHVLPPRRSSTYDERARSCSDPFGCSASTPMTSSSTTCRATDCSQLREPGER